MEQLHYNLLFRWFVGLEMDEPVWNHAVFSKNRERLLNQDIARGFFQRVLRQAEGHLSDEHFTVDGTLIEAWASQKSFQKKDGGGDDPGAGGNFHGHKRSNKTHQSKTDPDAKLYRKGGGQEAKLAYLGHVLMENRNGLIVDAMATTANGTAERDAAMLMVYKRWKKQQPIATLGADEADTRGLVDSCAMQVQPHVTQNLNRAGGSAIDGRTTRHPGLSDQPAETAVGGTHFWLDEIGRGHAQGEAAGLAQRGLVVPVHGGSVQSVADPEVAISRSVTGTQNAARKPASNGACHPLVPHSAQPSCDYFSSVALLSALLQQAPSVPGLSGC